MPDMIYVIDADQVPAGQARPARIGSLWYAVCNDNGTYRVTDIHCPHEGGPLGRGEVRDGCLICPVHHWPWNLDTGMTADNMPFLRLNVYPTEVREGKVYADVSAPLPPTLPTED
jgi:nitrite reductase/ring-hydroxylating ferredoxin subunit